MRNYFQDIVYFPTPSIHIHCSISNKMIQVQTKFDCHTMKLLAFFQHCQLCSSSKALRDAKLI
uniref:Uncharacterized protein n=1 Tax=Rhizophora mucronata TaxID=61149 RepID=A0A2P2IVB5_RHIMU